MNRFRPTAALLALLALAGLAGADRMVEFQGHELHYIVFNSTMLTPEIARQYDLPRSGRMGIVNLAVLEQREDDVGVPVEAEVSVRVRNLLGQSNPLPLEVVREQNAIYHLGSVRFDDREMLWFDVTVELPGQPAFEHSFSQEMWEESS